MGGQLNTNEKEEKRKPGRPPKISGKAKRVFLDDETIKSGAEIGRGNLSEGIRIAVKYYKKHEKEAGV